MNTNFKLPCPAGTKFLTERDQAHALERARKRRMAALEDRELLRLELRDKWYLEKLHGYMDKLDNPSELTGRDIQAIKTGSDIALKLLAKVLPDLKAVEKHEDPLKERDPTKCSSEELRRNIWNDAMKAIAAGKEIHPTTQYLLKDILGKAPKAPIPGEYKVVEPQTEEPQTELPEPRRHAGRYWPFG